MVYADTTWLLGSHPIERYLTDPTLIILRAQHLKVFLNSDTVASGNMIETLASRAPSTWINISSAMLSIGFDRQLLCAAETTNGNCHLTALSTLFLETLLAFEILVTDPTQDSRWRYMSS